MAENEFEPATLNDDAHSVRSSGSTTSITNSKMQCPYCPKEVQARVLFNHIRKIHPQKYVENMVDCTPKHFDSLIKGCEPVDFTWEIKNDFDEMEPQHIYGCLACNTAFTTKSRGIIHCKKNKCISEHLNQLRKLRTEAVQAEKERKKTTTRLPEYYQDLAMDLWLATPKLKASYDKLYSIYEDLLGKCVEHSILHPHVKVSSPLLPRPNSKARDIRKECITHLKAHEAYANARDQLLRDLLWEGYRAVEVRLHDVPMTELPDYWPT